jgi:hypothetical protein
MSAATTLSPRMSPRMSPRYPHAVTTVSHHAPYWWGCHHDRERSGRNGAFGAAVAVPVASSTLQKGKATIHNMPRSHFIIRVRPGLNVDAIKALRLGLKALGRLGLRAVEVKECPSTTLTSMLFSCSS